MLRYNKPLILKTESAPPVNEKKKSKLNKLDYDTVKTLASNPAEQPNIKTTPTHTLNRRPLKR
jgi:hypothetical protein